MYATLRKVKIQPGTAAEIGRRVEAGFVPLVSRLSGFVAFYLVDHGETVSTFTLFSERATAEQANQQAAVWVKENLGDLIAGALEMSVGEVIAQEAIAGDPV